jgi:prephenate dehydrogenase
MPALFKNALVMGLGVIGGSLAAGLKKHGIAERVTGYALANDVDAALRACALDSAFSTESDLPGAIANADLVVLALPVHLCISLLPTLEIYLQDNAVLTDVCSVKKAISDAVTLQLVRTAAQFVPAHPIAGSHLSGFEGASTDLFEGATVILAPCPNDVAFGRVRRMWEALGAQVEVMSNELHDEHYAIVSHLPHVVAFALTNTVQTLTEKDLGDTCGLLTPPVGKGFLDTTRIAASSGELWAGICVANQQALLISLDEFIVQISDLRRSLGQNDATGLRASFERASEFRQRVNLKQE